MCAEKSPQFDEQFEVVCMYVVICTSNLISQKFR